MNDGPLYERYTVTHKDGAPVNPERRYFVLSDNDPASRPALIAYEQAIRQSHPTLAADLRRTHQLPEPEPIPVLQVWELDRIINGHHQISDTDEIAATAGGLNVLRGGEVWRFVNFETNEVEEPSKEEPTRVEEPPPPADPASPFALVNPYEGESLEDRLIRQIATAFEMGCEVVIDALHEISQGYPKRYLTAYGEQDYPAYVQGRKDAVRLVMLELNGDGEEWWERVRARVNSFKYHLGQSNSATTR